MNHVVIGAGEVGTAIAEVLSIDQSNSVTLRDVSPIGPLQADVIHICYPWSDRFDEITTEYILSYKARMCIVHSTVPVGTCDALGVVHSPVRGKHPYLAESVRTFVKFFGGIGADGAAEMFKACGVKVAVRPHAKDTEAAKLWELAQYGLNIFVEKHIHEFCAANDLDFNTVYTDFAVTYNAGYKELGDAQFVRPVLRHIPGPIGGHCVVPGSQLLNDPLADLVAQAGVDSLLGAQSANT